ncbi:MAG TPA: sigma-70 family RNA polymerase sigma factor [Polyangiales bacterium]|nr:sigma-70 family RNA polymerase sigma factor [Polyangiales bacterium]
MDAYRRYAPALLRKAERLLQNRDDAQDIVQGLFLDVLQEGDAARLDLPYLYRALTNRCLNMLRDNSTHRRLLSRHDAVLRGPVRVTCEERTLDLDLLTKLAATLDRETAEILVYRFVDELGQEEIADLVGLSRKTVGQRLSRIRDAVATLTGGAP